MKRILLHAALTALSSIGAQAHIGWDLQTCQDKYGVEVRPFRRANAGNVHYFSVNNGDMAISVILSNDKVKEIFYRKTDGSTFSSDEIDILQKKNQAEILGAEGIEWVRESADVEACWSLSRQGQPLMQSLLVNQGTPRKAAYVLVIRTWEQIGVDKAAAKQDQLDKLQKL